MRNNFRCAAVVLAAGSGKRMGQNIPKQYMTVASRPLLYYCLNTFQKSFIDDIYIVTRQEDISYVRDFIVTPYGFDKVRGIIPGGRERYHSVALGLEAIAGAQNNGEYDKTRCDFVFIHDGARPFVTDEILNDAFESVVKYGTAVAGVPSKDTVKILDEKGFVADTPVRSSVYIMQTPQTFKFTEILECYRKLTESEDSLKKDGISITDDAMVMEHFGNSRVYISHGDYRNIKVTTPEDAVAANIYAQEYLEKNKI